MSDTWFVSDMHFGHTNIIAYCNRPFNSVEEMDQALVENWNKAVKPTDVVWHLGDWAFHNYEHIGQLNGFIRSVPGNHDHERAKKILPYLPNGFEEEVVYLKIDKEHRFVLSHYPYEAWRREYRYHLHGHTHGMTGEGYAGYRGPMPNRLDVGIDATKLYRPIHLDEVMERLNGTTRV
jgi:calcineurin-like phosphoesterase family protein